MSIKVDTMLFELAQLRKKHHEAQEAAKRTQEVLETEQIRRNTIVFWGETPLIFVRWNGGVDIKQNGQTIYLPDQEIKEFLKTLKMALALPMEGN